MQIGELRESNKPTRCAYCHAPAGASPVTCEACGTQLHAECVAALGVCPTLGCGRLIAQPRSHENAGVPWRRIRRLSVIFAALVVPVVLALVAVTPALRQAAALRRLIPCAAPLAALTGHSAEVHGLAFSPAGDLLASSGTDSRVYVWALPSGERVGALETVGYVPVGFTRSGALLLPAAQGSFELRDPRTGSRSAAIETKPPCAWHKVMRPRPLVQSAENDRFAIFSTDDGLYVYSLDGEVGCYTRGSRARNDDEWSVARAGDGISAENIHEAALSPDGKLLAVTVSLWHSNTRNEDRVRVWSLAENRLACDIGGGAERLFFMDTDELALVRPDWEQPDGQCNIEIVSSTTGARRRLIPTGFIPGDRGDSITTPTPVDDVWSVALSSDGRFGAAGGAFGDIRIFSLADGKPLAAFQAHHDIVSALAFSPDGRTLASASFGRDGDHAVKLWAVR